MGSSVVVSRNLIKSALFSRHAYAHAYACACACACASRRNNFHSNANNNVVTSLSDREIKEEREGFDSHFLVQRFCKRASNHTHFSLVSSENNWAAPVRDFRSPNFCIWPSFTGVCDGVYHFSGNDPDWRELLWMPSLNQFKVLPPSKMTCLPGASYMRFHSSGFGFDSKSLDYKVVRFADHDFGDPGKYPKYTIMQAELYSLKNDSWKDIPELPILKGSYWPTWAYVSGRYYWRYIEDVHHSSIISFDFSTEKFSRVTLPPQLHEKWEILGVMYKCMLVEVDGKLGMVIYYTFPGTHKSLFELWVLQDHDAGPWTRAFEIRCLFNVRYPLFYSSDAGVLFLRGDDGELMVYDVRNGELKKLGGYRDIMVISPYIATPLSASAPWISP